MNTQYLGSTQFVLGASFLNVNPVLKVREGYIIYDWVQGGATDTTPTSPLGATTINRIQGFTWQGITNVKIDDGLGATAELALMGNTLYVDGCTEGGDVTGYLYNGWRMGSAQSFVLNEDTEIYSVYFRILRNGGLTALMDVKIYDDIGTSYGLNSKPGSTILATSDVVGTTFLDYFYDEIPFQFSGVNQITLGKSKGYFASLGFSYGGVSNYIAVALNDGTSVGWVGHSGNWAVYQSSLSGWTPRGNIDQAFMLWGIGTTSTTTNYIVVNNFGFSLSSERLVSGIEFGFKCGITGTILDSSILAIKSGGSFAPLNNSFNTDISGGDTYIVYGGLSSLWGANWGYSDINNSKFGVAASFSGDGTVSVDHIYAKIYSYGNTYVVTTSYNNIGEFPIVSINDKGINNETINIRAKSKLSISETMMRPLSANTGVYSSLRRHFRSIEDIADITVGHPDSWGLTGGGYVLNKGFLGPETLVWNINTAQDGLFNVGLYFENMLGAGGLGNTGTFGIMYGIKDVTSGNETYKLYRSCFGQYQSTSPLYERGYATMGLSFETWVNGSLIGSTSARGTLPGKGIWAELGSCMLNNFGALWYQQNNSVSVALAGFTYNTDFNEDYIDSNDLYPIRGIDNIGEKVGLLFDGISLIFKLQFMEYSSLGSVKSRDNIYQDLSADMGLYNIKTQDASWTGFSLKRISGTMGTTVYAASGGTIFQTESATVNGIFVTPSMFDDFVLEVDTQLDHTGKLGGGGLVCGITQNMDIIRPFGDWMNQYSSGISISYGTGSGTNRSLLKPFRGCNGLWVTLKMVRIGPDVVCYMNDEYFARMVIGRSTPQNTKIFVGLIPLYGPVYYRNFNVYSIDSYSNNIQLPENESIANSFNRFKPYTYDIRLIGETLELYEIGVSGAVYGMTNPTRITKTENLHKSKDFIYAKGKNIGSIYSGISGQIQQDGSKSSYASMSDYGIDSITVLDNYAKLEIDRELKNSNIYNITTGPNLNIAVGDKVSLGDENVGLNGNYEVGTFLKQYDAGTGSFQEYITLKDDD